MPLNGCLVLTMLFQLVNEYGMPWKTGISTTIVKSRIVGSRNSILPIWVFADRLDPSFFLRTIVVIVSATPFMP